MSAPAPPRPLRTRIVLAAFDGLYRSPPLYWLASTVPFAGQWRTWQRLALPYLQGCDVLELGCGPGWLLAEMAAAGFQCRAIDASPAMVRAARRHLARRRRTAEVSLGRAQALPVADASVDTVVSTFPTPYITDPATLREVARVLRPGGRLVIVEGAGLMPAGPLLRPLVWLQRLVYGRAAPDDPPRPDLPAAVRQRLPLAAVGLTAHSVIVNGPFWRAFLIIADKLATDAGAVTNRDA